MSTVRRSARIAAKNAAKNAEVNVIAPTPSKGQRDADLIWDAIEVSHWLYTHWDEKKVHDKDYLTYYIDGGRTRLHRIANHIEDTMNAIRRQLPKNPDRWNKVLDDLKYSAGSVIWAIRDYMPDTKDGIYIKDDADWILYKITGDKNARY